MKYIYIYTLADASPIRSMTSISCLRNCLASYLKNINVKLYERKILHATNEFENDWLASQLSCKSFMNCWYTVSRVSLESNL